MSLPETPIPPSRLPLFDPRNVPIAGTDTHLPGVDAGQLLPAALRQRFARPPVWQPEVLAEKRFTDRRTAHAAVLVPIIEPATAGGPATVLLTERAATLSTHSGQVAFPGGRIDAGDASAAAAALREAHEEVGLAPGEVEVIGELPTYFTGTAFVVTPVVALVRRGAALQANPGEVADLFEVPLHFLMTPANHHRHVLDWQGEQREWFSMPYLDNGRERYIWGATAGMLRNLYRFLSA